MRICYLATWTASTEKMAKYFAKRGNEVHFITFDAPIYDYDPEEVVVHDLHRSGGSPIHRKLLNSVLYRTIRARQEINRIQPDIIHSHYVTEYGIIGLFLRRHPFVLSVWGSDILIDLKGRMGPLILQALRAADHVHCDGRNTYQAVIEQGIRPPKVSLIYFGVDTGIFRPDPPDEGRLGEEAGPVKRIISTRMHRPIFDVGTLIEAIPLVLKDYPDARFTIVGGGPLRETFMETAKKTGIDEVTDFPGIVPNSHLPHLLNAADIYVSTSLSDSGLAISTAEAMACGLPVIITDFGDNANWVEENKNGFVIPARSPQALAEKIVYLCKHPLEREQIGMNNWLKISEEYNYYREMKKIAVVYSYLMNGGGK